jgi:serine/threonine protein kinase
MVYPEDEMAPPSPEIVGRYAIYGKIAAGGMASVHFGRLLGGAGFSRTVAIKRLHPHLAEDPEFRSTMIDEARLAARIHHPNVVPTLDVVASDGALLLVMEYVRGESLARLMKIEVARGGRVPLPIASAIAIGALHGLHAAHEARSDRGTALGIVHRDVSPQNILVGIDGMPRVIDFGVAKAAGRLQTTQEGVIKGKIAYMAPEQLAASPVTRAADVYAMGVVLWELLAGQRLFVGDNNVALFGSVLAGAKDPPSRHSPNLPAALDALVMKALARDAADRFESAVEMAEMLTRLLPPALSTEVGRWCDDAARDSLSKRESVLADIESSSGMDLAASLAGGSDPLPRDSARGRRRDAGGPPAATDVSHDLSDDAPTTASQASSLAIETPASGAQRAERSRRTVLASFLGAALVLTLGALLIVFRGQTPAAAGPSAETARPLAASVPSQVSADAPKVAVPPSPTVSPPLPASDPPVSPIPPATTTRRRSTPVAPAPQPASRDGVKPKVDCDPPYQFDSQGKKTWKRECL